MLIPPSRWSFVTVGRLDASNDARHDRARGLQQPRDATDGGDCTSCTRLVQWTPRMPASPALPGPTAASAADADRAALHTTASGVPNEHVSRLRQWFCSCASTTITPTAERINWYGKQTNCCIGSTERLQRAPARALTLMTMDEDNCSCFFDELGRCNGL